MESPSETSAQPLVNGQIESLREENIGKSSPKIKEGVRNTKHVIGIQYLCE